MLSSSNALAACSPAAADGVSVVCEGIDTAGVGTGAENNVDVTVLSGASVITDAGKAIDLDSNVTITNFGTIQSIFSDGVAAESLTRLTNFGTIQGGGDGVFSDNSPLVSLTNSGTILGIGDHGINVENIDRLTNSGIIQSMGDDGINSDNIDSLTNSGLIQALNEGIEADDIGHLTNSGTIRGGNRGIKADEISRITNSGTIQGGIRGIQAGEISRIINSGTIQGASFAIVENLSDDTRLTLNAGSVLIGRVDLGGGVNTLNLGERLSLNSTFESDGGATLVSLGTTGSQLIAVAPVTINGNNEIQVVAIDQSTFASFDGALTALTSGIGGVVQSRQSAVRSTPPPGGSSSFASRYATAEETSRAPFSDLDLNDAPHVDPNRFWIEGFGAYSQGKSDRVGRAFDVLSGGLVAGADMPLDAHTSLGVMAGFAVSTSENEFNAQTTDAISFYAGIYASKQAMGVAWDASLTLGYTDYNAQRITANNLMGNGLETAEADFGGFFITPQITMTREAANPLASSGIGALMATNTLEQSLTLRYAGLFLDGYTETGTTNPLTLDGRSVHIASARAALALPFEQIHADGTLTTLRLIGGVEGRTQFGDDTVSGTLLGQAVSITVDGDDDAFTGGAFLGLASEYETTTGLTAHANIEAMLETDKAYQLSANAGLIIPF